MKILAAAALALVSILGTTSVADARPMHGHHMRHHRMMMHHHHHYMMHHHRMHR